MGKIELDTWILNEMGAIVMMQQDKTECVCVCVCVWTSIYKQIARTLPDSDVLFMFFIFADLKRHSFLLPAVDTDNLSPVKLW